MKYISRKKRKLLKRLRGGDDYLDKDIEILSRGGKLQKSHKKRIGDILNKNIEKRYNAISKVNKRIDDLIYDPVEMEKRKRRRVNANKKR